MEEMRGALLTRDRELQMMLGGIAHEVRNPLGGMELFVGLLREDLAESPEQLQLLVRVERELGNLKHVVEGFLDFARQMPLEKGPLSLAELIVETSMLTEGLTLECRVAPEVVVLADRASLGRLILNLLCNARQAGAGRVVAAYSQGTLTLEDDGPGIPADVAARVFEAFFTTREKGTGLGLAICRKLATAHGATLRLENPGEPGARFALGPLAAAAGAGGPEAG